MENCLYYGDNLDILRRYIKDESIDLIYLDPPFNSKATYNALFKEHNGDQSAAQLQAFEDTWHWDHSAGSTYNEVVEGGGNVAQALSSFRSMLGDTDMLAYLSMMAIRLVELRRVLKDSGSIYLHCDPVASHYLKILMDMIFGVENYRNEIIWKRTTAHNDPKRWGNVHDVLLFYSKSENAKWNFVYLDHSEEYKKRFTHSDSDGRLWADYDLTAKGLSGGGYTYEYKGFSSLWRVPIETMKRLDAENKLYFTKTGGIRIKRYLDELPGIIIQDVITDIFPINSQAAERLGYPTQKPLSLLERIIWASSDKGDVVLDPFCGCGTAVAAAQSLGRKWIGIDITYLAINVMKRRMEESFGDTLKFDIIGEPTSLPDAQALAENDPYQFQWWSLGLVGARPVEEKKGADRGIDGRLYFHEQDGGPTKQVIFSVKAGTTNAAHVRDLHGVIDREGAEIGVLITMEEPTKPMRSEAASAGIYTSPWGNHPKIQILTVADLLDGKRIDMPPVRQTNITYKRATRSKGNKGSQKELFDQES